MASEATAVSRAQLEETTGALEALVAALQCWDPMHRETIRHQAHSILASYASSAVFEGELSRLRLCCSAFRARATSGQRGW